ncbi:unnamed protein product [Boreogadus saida]
MRVEYADTREGCTHRGEKRMVVEWMRDRGDLQVAPHPSHSRSYPRRQEQASADILAERVAPTPPFSQLSATHGILGYPKVTALVSVSTR